VAEKQSEGGAFWPWLLLSRGTVAWLEKGKILVEAKTTDLRGKYGVHANEQCKHGIIYSNANSDRVS
jgi:hypothetical protein